MASALKILLVEDDEDDAFLIHDLMREVPLDPIPQIHHVTTGDEALALLESETFDLCLFDFRLGVCDGIDLLQEVREKGCEVPIIFLTGQGDQETAVRAMKSGATDYLTKRSLSAETLFHSVRFAVKLKKQEDLRKHAEEELKKSHADLTKAHAELQQSVDKLRNAQDQIVRSEKLASVGRLAAGVCHEILNPLNIISGHVQALGLERGEDATLMEDFVSIMEEVKRIEKIISGLLKFSRKDDIELKVADINEELESVLSLTEKEMELDGIKIIRSFSAGLPHVKFDTNRLRQVFLNLINNARYAMSRGGRFTVSTQLVQDQELGGRVPVDPVVYDDLGREQFLRISFVDTGTGIKKKNLDKLFEPFFTTKPEDKGTGLGLSICYSIIEKHNGKLEVESEYGKGATFTIELPVRCSMEPQISSLHKEDICD